VRRTDDGEVVGRLLPSQEDDGRWVPATVFGATIGEPSDAETAVEVVRARGMAVLAERWWTRRLDDESAAWQPTWLLEVKPDKLRVRWDDPMWMSGGHGVWVRLANIEIRLTHP
jgi:hypothetical protein